MPQPNLKNSQSLYNRIERFVIRRFKVLNTTLLALLAILILLDINKAWVGVSGSDNYTLFISPVATGLAALFGIFIPLLIQRHEAMGTLALSVVSELYRNLSELEYMQQQFEKDYFEQEPDAEPTEHDRQSMEMGKVIGAAQRLDSALEDTAYRGIMNNRVIAQIDQSIARPIVEAYSGIASAKQTTRHFADFFSKIMDGEQKGIAPSFIQNARQNQVDKAIIRVKEDVAIAIKQINTAAELLNDDLDKYGLRQRPVYRDELLAENDKSDKPEA